MKLVIALLATIGAAAAAAFLWRKYQASASPAWAGATDSLSAWGKTAAEKAGETTDKFAEQAGKAADQVRSAGQ